MEPNQFVPFYKGPMEETNKFIPFHTDPEDPYKPLPMEQANSMYEAKIAETPYGKLKLDGLDDEQIKSRLEPIVTDMLNEGYDPETVYQATGYDSYKTEHTKYMNKVQFEIGQDVASATAVSTSLGRDLVSLFNSDYDEKYKQERAESLKLATDKLVSRGIIDSYDLEKNVGIKDGEEYPLDSSFLQSLAASKWELGLGVTGALASRNPFVTALTAGAGRALDVKAAAQKLGYEEEADDLAIQAAIAMGEDLGITVTTMAAFKLAKTGVKYAKDFIQDVGSDFINGGMESLKRLSGYTDDELKDITDSYLMTFNQGADIIARGPDSTMYKQASMEALGVTDPRFVSFTNAATRDSEATFALGEHLTERRNKLMAGISKYGDGVRGVDIVKEAKAIKQEAGALYGESQGALVKAFEGIPIDATELSRNIDGAVNMLKTSPEFVTRMTDREEKALSLLSDYVTKTDDMTTLLNTRTTYNGILDKLGLGKKAKVKTPEAERLLAVRDEIDSLIDASIAKNNLLTEPEKGFLKDSFKRSKELLRETYLASESALAKVMDKPGKEHDLLMDDLIKYAKAEDGEFEKFVGVLDVDTRKGVEIGMLQRLADKNIKKAVNFEQLGLDLTKIKPRIRSKEGQEVIESISDFQQLFKNEENLWRFTESFKSPEAGAGMAKSAVEKAKYQAMQRTWRNLQPTIAAMLERIPLVPKISLVEELISEGKTISISKNIAKSLKRAKTVRDFAADISQMEGTTPQLSSSIRDFIRMYDKIHQDYESIRPEVRAEMARRQAQKTAGENIEGIIEIETRSKQLARDAVDTQVIHQISAPKGTTLYGTATGEVAPELHMITRAIRDAKRFKDEASKIATTDSETIQQAFDKFETTVKESPSLSRNEFNAAWNDYVSTLNDIRGRSIGLQPTTKTTKIELPKQTMPIEDAMKNPQTKQMFEWHIGDSLQEKEALKRLDSILPKMKGNYTGSAYRGIKATDLDGLKPGDYFSSDTRMSFSTSRKVAEDEFAGGGKKTVFIIDKFPVSRKAFRLKEYFPDNVLAKHEDEVLVAPESVFRIKKKTEKDGNVIFHIEQVFETEEGKQHIKSSKAGGKYASQEM